MAASNVDFSIMNTLGQDWAIGILGTRQKDCTAMNLTQMSTIYMCDQ